MLLYHISSHPFNEIKPQRLQGMTPVKLADIDRDFREWGTPPYTWSMSFFFDPPPYSEFRYHYGGNDRWKPGSTVYEHKIDVSSLVLPLYWRIVESPINTAMHGRIWDSIDDKLWFRLRWEMLAITGHMGFDVDGLKDAMKKYSGTTSSYYRKLWSSPEFENLKDHYAPNVPHLMIWSGNPVQVESIKKVVIPKSR